MEFVARQPIFDDRGRLAAYELLFRSGPENVFAHDDPDEASRSVINDSLEVHGFERLTGGRLAFVNVTREVLVDGHFRRLPPELTVLELLETIEADEEVIDACREARRDGYLLALDDFVFHAGTAPLLDHVDFVKVDFQQTTSDERADWLLRLGDRPLRLLAEKIETREEFEDARAHGFTYFQGYYFERPEMMAASAIAPEKRAALRLAAELMRPSTPFERLEARFRSTPVLTARLLGDLNAAADGRTEVRTVRDARKLLGDRGFRRWASMVTLSTLGDARPPELLVTALVRARFAERVARVAHLDEGGLFFAGMLTATALLLGRPMEDVFACVDLSGDAALAWSDETSRPALLLALVLAYERGDWNAVLVNADRLDIDEDVLPECFLEAIGWANEVCPH